MAAHPSPYDTLFGCAPGVEGRVVVLGVPYDRGTPPLHAGAAAAPAALRKLSAPSYVRADVHGLYDHARGETLLPAGALTDLGDIRFRVHRSDEAYLDQIGEATRVLAREKKRLLLLGGDHLVTLASLRGVADSVQELQVVQLDAHHDYEQVEEGELPTHGSFVAHLVREGLAKRVVQVGIRGLGWGAPTAPEGVSAVGVADVASALLPGVPVYLSVDTDGFDPTLAGAVNFPEHEGLTLADLDLVLRQIAAVAPVIGADWTEYNPSLDTRNSLTGHFILRGLSRILRALAAPTT